MEKLIPKSLSSLAKKCLKLGGSLSVINSLYDHDRELKSRVGLIIINDGSILYDSRIFPEKEIFFIYSQIDNNISLYNSEQYSIEIMNRKHKLNFENKDICRKYSVKIPYDAIEMELKSAEVINSIEMNKLRQCLLLNKRMTFQDSFSLIEEIRKIIVVLETVNFYYGIKFQYFYSMTKKLKTFIGEYQPMNGIEGQHVIINVLTNKNHLIGYLPDCLMSGKKVQRRRMKKNSSINLSLKNNTIETRNHLYDCISQCCESNLECDNSNKICLDMTKFKPSMRRINAINVKTPLLIKLYEFGYLTRSEVIFSGKIDYSAYVSYQEKGDDFLIVIYHFEDRIEEYVQKSFTGKKNNGYEIFVEFVNYISSVCDQYKSIKSFFLKKYLRSRTSFDLQENKGTYGIFSKEVKNFMDRICVYGFGLSHSFLINLEMTLKLMKKSEKSHVIKSVRNKNGDVSMITGKNFFLRDFKNFFGETNTEQKEIDFLIALENEMKRYSYSNDFLVKMRNMIRGINEFFGSNYFGFNFDLNYCSSFGMIALSHCFYEASKSYMSMSPMKSSPQLYSLLCNFNYGGATFNTCNLIECNSGIRSEFRHNKEIKNIIHYDQKSCYGNAFYKNSVFAGNALHYRKTNTSSKEDFLELESTTYDFLSEKLAVYATIWNTMCDDEYEIISVRHSFTTSGQITLGKFGIDLTLIMENKNGTPNNRHIVFVNFHGSYWHACKNCHTSESKYKDSLSFDELSEITRDKDSEIRDSVSQLYPNYDPNQSATYIVKYLCCDFNDFVDKKTGKIYSNLMSFFKTTEHDEIKMFRKYLRKSKRLNKETIIQKYVLVDEEKSKYFDGIVIAKVTIPVCEQSNSCGVIYTKMCHACESTKYQCTNPSDHQSRLVVANSTQKFTIFNISMLKFLIREKKAIIDDISHFVLYSKSDAFRKYVEKPLKLRQLFAENDCKNLSTLNKFFINVIIGM